MAHIKYEVTAITGKYKDRDGAEKTKYLKVGVIIETDKGLRLKMEAVPLGWDGWAFLQEPKPKEGAKPAEPKKPDSSFADFESDIPFN